MYIGFWKRVLINGIIFIAIAGLYSSGLHVANIWVAFIAAFILGLLNTFVKPILVIFSLPITFFTMGLFYFVINALMLETTSAVLGEAFHFSSFGSALIVAIIMSVSNLIITNYLINR